MKKFLTVLFSVIVAFALALFVGCKDDTQKVSLTLDKQTAKIGVFEELTLTASFSDGEQRALTWMTSDETVVTVAGGVVTGQKLGTATVTATSGDVSAKCEITVVANAEVLINTNFVDNQVHLVVGKTGVTVVPTVYYGGSLISDGVVSYQSENTAVATVSEDGLITPVDKGTANVIVTADVGGVKGERIISVSVENDNQLEVASAMTIYAKDFTQDGTTPTSAQITPSLTVNGEIQTSVSYTYSVRENGVATVDANGVVTAVKGGSAIVDIKTTLANGEEVSAYVNVTVAKASFTLPDSTVLKMEKYALYDTDMTMTYLDLTAIDEYVKAAELVAIKDGAVTVPYEVKNGNLHIKTQELGAYEYTFETEFAFITVQCEYVTEQFLMLRGNTHLNPYYEHETYKNYSQYTTLKRTKVVEGYNEIKWKSQVKEGADVMAFVNKSKVNTTGDSGDIAFSFAENVTDINPLNYDYLAFDMRTYWSGSSTATSPIQLAITVNGTTDWSYLPGEKLSQSSFGSVGKIAKAYDNNGVETAYALNEWQTVVLDISQITEMKNDTGGIGGKFIRVTLNQVASGGAIAFTNIRLMTKELYDLSGFTASFGTEESVLTPNTELTPSVTVKGEAAALTLQSSDETVAKVENGKFSLMGEGEVTLSMTFKLAHGGEKTVSKTYSVYALDNYEASFGVDGDEFENVATPTVKLRGQEITDFTLESSNTSIVKVENGKFVALANGEVTLSLHFTLRNGTQKTVTKTVTAKFVPEKMLLLENTANPYVDELKNYGQYKGFKRETVTAGYTELGDWASVKQENADVLAFTWNSSTASTGDSGEIAFSFAPDAANANPLLYDYIEFDMFVYKATVDSNVTLAWSFNDSERIWGFKENSDLANVTFGSYGNIAKAYDGNGAQTTFAYGKWLKVRFDITGLETVATAFNREGGRLIRVILNGANAGDMIAFANLKIGINQ